MGDTRLKYFEDRDTGCGKNIRQFLQARGVKRGRKRKGEDHDVETPENVKVVRQAIKASSRRSVRRHSRALNISEQTWR